jgi:SAM-dependent methyltransferase
MKLTRETMAGSKKDYHPHRAFQIRFLLKHGLARNHKVLDIGCGNLRGGLPIIKYLSNGNYYGIDCRQVAIDDGLAELKEKNLMKRTPRLYVNEDLKKVCLNVQFDIIWAYRVLIHMTDDILDDCLDLVFRHLKEDGRFLCDVNIGDKEGGTWLEFPLIYRSVDFYTDRFCAAGLDLFCDTKSPGVHTNLVGTKR